MTQQVRKSYRNHRKAAWAVVLALVGLMAAVAIPLASGASDKTFTLTLSPPACAGGSVTVTIANTAKTQTLGSIEVYFPEGSVSTTSRGVEQTDPSRDPIRIDNLNLPKGSSTSFTVTLNPGPQSGTVTAVGKQSNMFHGTGNDFESPPPQQLSTMVCGTVQGRVFHDRNADGQFVIGDSSIVDNGDLPKAWTVKVFQKNVGAPSYPSTPFASTTSSATTGEYSVGLPFNKDYKLCVEAAGTDASKAWGLQGVAGQTAAICSPISPSSNPPATAPGYELLNLNGNHAGKDFVVVPVTGVAFGAGSTSTVDGYTVKAGDNNPHGKQPQRFTHEVWFDQNGGRANFRFAPVTPCTGTCTQKLFLIETLEAEVNRPSDGQLELEYDDVPPFLESELHAMRYCLIDPRPPSGNTLVIVGVLPSPTASDPQSSSCIIEGHQTVIAGGKIRFKYVVYSTIDGYRGGH